MNKKKYVTISLSVILCSTVFVVLGGANLLINASASNPLIVETEYGMVMGKEWDDGTYSWLGIPFAKPPVGELRWKAPVDPDSWSGILETTEFPQAPLQFANWMASIDEEAIREYRLIGTEDCLYLNVWAPKGIDISATEGLPVYVYVYGGGNIVGQTDFPVYYGANLANRANCVVVTMGYRVGAAGWFNNPALHVGNPLDDSGNYALLDIFKSFEWVKTNIENFGGNPNDITIAGESAGAMNVYATLTSPYLKQEFFDKGVELFHRAVIESGGMIPSSTDSAIEASEEVIAGILVINGLASDLEEAATIVSSASDAQKKAWLLDEPMENIFNLFAADDVIGLLGMITGVPSIISDGYVCSSNPYVSLMDGNYIQVPTIIGCNAEEAKVFIAWMLDEPLFTDVMFGHPHPEDLIDYFDSIRPWSDILGPYLDWILIDGYGAAAYIVNKIIQLVGVDIPASLMSIHQENIYTYKFSWDQEPEPFDILVGACHGSEIPFIFGNVGADESFPFGNALWSDENAPGRMALSNAMISYWSNFMRTGNPGDPDGYNRFDPGLPEWTAYNGMFSPNDERIIFDATNTEVDIYMD